MGVVARLLSGLGYVRKMSSLELFREIYGGRESSSGAVVNWKTALEVSTVLACCKVIAEGVAQVPFRVYEDDGDSKTVAKDHPLNLLLYRQPNPWQTSFEFRETIVFHTILTGNAFVFVNRVGIARTVRELVPIEPGRVEVRQTKSGALEYKVSAPDGAVQTFGQDSIWHLRGPSWNSWLGLDATRLAREAIGLSMSIEHGQAEFQKNGGKTSGVLSVEEKMGPEKFEFLAAWLDKHAPGGARYGKPLIADQGATFTSMAMSAVDAQLIETRKFQVEDICRSFRVMPIMIGQADKAATYASAEQMFLAHVIHCLSPWYERIEQSADVALLSPEDRGAGFYTKFTPNALMRGAATDRANFYAKALGSGGTKGWMTQNEVRKFEELPTSDDPLADELPQPVVRPSGAPTDTPAP